MDSGSRHHSSVICSYTHIIAVVWMVIVMAIWGSDADLLPRSTKDSTVLVSKSRIITTILLSSSVAAAARVDRCRAVDMDSISIDVSLSIEEAANLIRSKCTKILEASRSTGRLLYRGEVPAATYSPYIRSAAFDLLSSSTYNSTLAADYFRCLDSAMATTGFPVTPSSGHLAVSDVVVASQWGEPVSVWPMDEGLHYAWLQGQRSWWNPDWAFPQSVMGPTFWRSTPLLQRFVADQLRYDRGIEAALANENEVLFGNVVGEDTTSRDTAASLMSPSPKYRQCQQFVAIPLRFEPSVLRLLDVIPFSTKPKILLSKEGMQLTGVPVRKRLDPLQQLKRSY